MSDPTFRAPRASRYRLPLVVSAAAILALGLGARAEAFEGVASNKSPQGGSTLQIPADSPLARNEHPRLLFTKAQLLWATDGGVSEMLPAELVERDGALGARVQAPGGDVTVTFATTGPVAGHITIQSEADPVDVDLPTRVLDECEAWRNDPRYERWITDPYLKAALTRAPEVQ